MFIGHKFGPRQEESQAQEGPCLAGSELQAWAAVTIEAQPALWPASSLPTAHVTSLSHVFLPNTSSVAACPCPSPPEIFTQPHTGLASLD